MKPFGLYKSVVVSVVLIGVVGLLACSAGNEGQVPLTTSSAEAREHFVQGRALLEKLRAQEAVPHFERAVKADPSFAMAHLYLASAQQTPKQFFESYHRAVTLIDNVSKGERLWILGFQAGVNGDSRKQEQYYQRLVEAYPNDVRAVTLLGSYYFGQQAYEQAIDYYKRAEQIDPEYSPIYNQLGYSYRYLGQFDKAEDAFQKYIELIPDDPNPYDSYAELLLKFGKFDKSIEMYQKALEINPAFVFSYGGIATNLMLKGDHRAARARLAEMFEASENDGRRRQALIMTAYTHIDQGDFEQALEQFEKVSAIAAAAHDSTALSNDMVTRAVVMLEAGRLDAAEEALEQAWEYLQNADVSAEVRRNAEQTGHFVMTRVMVARGNLDSARTHYRQYAERARKLQSPSQLRATHELAGIIALAEEDYEKAVAEFKQASQRSPYTYYRLGLAYEGMGEMKEARRWYHKAATFNEVVSLSYALVRQKAADKAAATS